MLNDRLGDCTIAGLYHRRQVVKYFDEAYALVDADLIAARTGKSILGMTLEQTQAAAELLAA